MRVSARLRILFCLLVLTGAALAAQTPAGQLRRPGLVAVHATTPIDLREWDTRINQMVGGNQLVVLSARTDPDISFRTHESLAQYHQGIPVYGASLSRQTAQGASVSIIGTVFENVSVDSSTAMSASQIVRGLAEAVGAQPAGDVPRSVIT